MSFNSEDPDHPDLLGRRRETGSGVTDRRLFRHRAVRNRQLHLQVLRHVQWCFYCSFPMRFSSSFRIEVENRDRDTDTEVYANILYQLTGDLPSEFGYIHAQFNTGRNTGPEPLHLAEATGHGHYAGCTLSMQAETHDYLRYLEAPEYIYTDDDWDTARIVGTGLEDYFMGGWYFRDGCFHSSLHGLPVKDTLNSMVAMYRGHEADAVRF